MLFSRIKLVGAQRQPILRRAAGEIILGQIGPVDRRRAIVAQHHDAAAIVAPPQHLGRGEAGGAAADDDDLAGRIRRRGPAARFWLLALVLDEDAAVRAARPASTRADSAPARAPPRRCADRSRRDARDSARSRRPRGRRRAARDSGCNARRSRTSRRRCARAAPPRRRHGRASLPPAKSANATPLVRSGPRGARLFLRHRRVPPFTQVMPRNCWRSCGLSRKHPSIRLVTRLGVRLVHAARRHAVVDRLDDDADAVRLEHLVDRIGDLRGELLLDLQAPGIDLDHARELADADHAAARNIGHAGVADDRRHVVLAMALEANIAQHHHLVIALDLLEGFLQDGGRVLGIAGDRTPRSPG